MRVYENIDAWNVEVECSSNEVLKVERLLKKEGYKTSVQSTIFPDKFIVITDCASATVIRYIMYNVTFSH